MTQFIALDADAVRKWVCSRDSLQRFFREGETVEVSEVGDGNLNMVYVVRGTSGSVIVKQALPYLRVAGESWPLTRERMRYETQALHEHNRLAPGLVPKVYDEDEDLSVVVMEHLDGHINMRHALVARRKLPYFTEHITTFLVQTLFFTSDLYLTGEKKKVHQARYVNAELRRLQEDFVYTNPYAYMEENQWNPAISDAVETVRTDGELKILIAEAKRAYMQHAEALIHADLHTGSIMVTDSDTRVIDPEFAFFGPIAYDVAAVIQNLTLNWLSHWAHTPDDAQRSDYRDWLRSTIHEVWRRFAEKFDETWKENNLGELAPNRLWEFAGGGAAFANFRSRYISRLLQQVALHGGVKLLRRTMGIVSVWDITSIADPAVRAIPERIAIATGRRWILEHDTVRHIDQLTDILEEEAAKVETRR